jgi:hypothetical protein
VDVIELAELYRRAQEVRDEAVRQNVLQSLAQIAGTADALEKARRDPAFGTGDPDPGTARLVELAVAEVQAAGEAAGEVVAEEGRAGAGVEVIAAEAQAAEAIAAEALSAEAMSAEPTELMFSGEPLAVEAAVLEGVVAEGTDAIGSSLRTFVAENARDR